MQLSFDAISELPQNLYEYGVRTSGETHGVVLTKPHIVSLILDLARYTSDRDLTSLTLLEPACGEGAFLVTAVDRLLRSAAKFGVPESSLEHAISAFDIDTSHVERSRAAVTELLRGRHAPLNRARRLAEKWINQGDFLLLGRERQFDVVVGNPPYVRIEQLDKHLQREYRHRFGSLYDRADLYVAFIEQSIRLLTPAGVLSFICADRWISNKYGAPLRRIVAEQCGVECYVDLHTASPFESDVIAYPSIFALRRGKTRQVHVVRLNDGSKEECEAVLPSIERGRSDAPNVKLSVHSTWFEGDEPWIISSPEHFSALRALEARCPPLEADGRTRVGIGVATGCDRVYVVSADADIEEDRLVPLVMREDIDRGRILDARRAVINTFTEDGKVVDLDRFPRLERYLAAHGSEVRNRHVAQKSPKSWFRTIDRVYPSLVAAPKLLIPDIAGSNEVVYDSGRYHPHHNLYFVTSETWDIEVLGGLLSSRVALFFVWSYAVKMRGGYLRFQAQYLRRIRVPRQVDISPALAKSVRAAFRRRDFSTLDQLALKAYGVDSLPDFDFVDTRK